jgi:glycosyltransferase involved in cell wall biosynthesis
VSVLITTYERHRDLAQCMRAVVLQQGPNVDVEICVVNDGGRPIDDVVRSFEGATVRYTNFIRNYGQVEARNAALEMATGEFIAICDDDDRWLPGHVNRLLDALQGAGSGAVLAYSDAEIVSLRRQGDSVIVRDRRAFAWSGVESLLCEYNPIVPSSVVYRRSVHAEVGAFDKQVSHYWDWDFFLRCQAVGPLVRVPVCDTLYALHGDGANLSANPADMNPALDVLCQKHKLGKLPVSNFYLMTEDRRLQSYRADTTLLWDGNPEPWWTDVSQIELELLARRKQEV